MTTEKHTSTCNFGDSACKYMHSVMDLHMQMANIFIDLSNKAILTNLFSKWLTTKMKIIYFFQILLLNNGIMDNTATPA